MAELFLGLAKVLIGPVVWVFGWFPRFEVIHWHERIVIWKGGRPPFVRKGSWLLYIPNRTSIQTVFWPSDYLDLTVDLLHSRKNYTISVTVQFSIDDAAAWAGRNQDSGDSLDDVVRGALFHDLMESEDIVEAIDALVDDSGDLEQVIQDGVNHFGVDIERVRLNGAAQTRPIRLLGDE